MLGLQTFTLSKAKKFMTRVNHRLTLFILLILLTLATWLRWQFITQIQPYPDEFATLLAVQMILEKGLPVLPSGLFYEHGLLFSYFGAATSTLFGFHREVVRSTSVLCGLLTIGLTWWLGRRWFSNQVGLIAAAFMTVAPTAILWSGRARMYALLQLAVLLTVSLAYTGLISKRPLYRWLALCCLLASTLTHFVAITIIPPLVLVSVFLIWVNNQQQLTADRRLRSHDGHWSAANALLWFEGLTVANIIGLAFMVKRLGQPKGIAPVSAEHEGILQSMGQVWRIYSDLSFDLWENWRAIGSFFTGPGMDTLSVLALLGLGLTVIGMGWGQRLWLCINSKGVSLSTPPKEGMLFSPPWAVGGAVVQLFLASLIVLTTLEMLFFVAPDRRDHKYLFMLLPLLCLLAAQGISQVSHILGRYIHYLLPTFIRLGGCVVMMAGLWFATADVLAKPGLDYDSAFAFVKEHWQSGDQILTGTPAASFLYLGQNDYYAVQADRGYEYRLLPTGDNIVDRWVGSPWLGTDEALHTALSQSDRVWLVLERWGLVQEYYPPLTQQRLLAATQFIAEFNGLIVLRSLPNRPLLPKKAVTPANINFDYKLILQGYTLTQDSDGRQLHLTKQWFVMNTLPYNYSIFMHLRDATGQTIAQVDYQPLAPMYPTTLWPVGQTIRAHQVLSLPANVLAGEYGLWVGVYRLDTLERLPVVEDVSGENAVLLTQIEIEVMTGLSPRLKISP